MSEGDQAGRLRELFRAASPLSPEERTEYLRRECGPDQHLFKAVVDLLAAHDVTAPLDHPIPRALYSIGPYELVCEIGEGSMGVVYHARQREPIRRDVAIKIAGSGPNNQEIIARLASERQALAIMDHPNIARVYDAGATSDGRPYFVMELVRGDHITEYCSSKQLGVRERVELFIPVCHAVQHAHQKGIIHRDIKPSNILVANQDGQPIPKVIDFGLAKVLGQQLDPTANMTNIGTVMGTLCYMSPEQADVIRQDVDTRADVYSLGVVLYELLTGTTPLLKKTVATTMYAEVLQRIRDQQPPAPSVRLRHSPDGADVAALGHKDPVRLAKLVSGELDWIVMKALERDRARRYETPNALAQDLQCYLAGEPVEAGPPSFVYRYGRYLRKHRLAFSVAAAFTVILMAVTVVGLWIAWRAGRAERETREVNDFLKEVLIPEPLMDGGVQPIQYADPDLAVRVALDRAAARVGSKFTSEPLIEASMRQTIGRTYKDLGLYGQAEDQVSRALSIRQRFLGGLHPETLTSMDTLAAVYEREGKLAAAEPLYHEALDKRRRVLGAGHPDTLATSRGLSVLYYDQGKYQQAESLANSVLHTQSTLLGEDASETLITMGNLAAIYQVEHKYPQAEALYSRSIELYSRTLPKEAPYLLKVKTNLGELYSEEGKVADANMIFNNVLSIQKRVLGEDNRDTIYTLKDLAALYAAQAKNVQAEQLYKMALLASRKSLGDRHSITLAIMSGLAGVYQGQQRFLQAEALLGQVVAIRHSVLGESHPETLSAMSSLSYVMLRLRKYPEAEAEAASAAKLYEATGQTSWERYRNEGLLGASLLEEGKFAEAERRLLSAYAGMLQHQSMTAAESRRELQRDGQRIVRLYRSWGKQPKVIEWERKLRSASPPEG